MDFNQRQNLVRRICNARIYGTVKFNNEDYNVVITDPSIDLLSRADFLYNQLYKELTSNGNVLSLEESYLLLERDGKWSDDLEFEANTKKQNLIVLKETLPSLQFKKLQYKQTKQLIKKTEERIAELEATKNQLYNNTVEYFAEAAKRRYIISNSTALDNQDLLNNQTFQDILSVYYYIDNAVSSKEIRELARTDPWRLYWTVSKDTGTSLFNQSCVEMTDLQYALASWSRIYDFAYSSDNRPDEDTLNDDDAFDAWYSNEDKRIKQLMKNSKVDKIVGGNEVYVPADQEGAKEVYALNDDLGRRRIREREKALAQRGVIKEGDMPDVKRDMQMELNKMAMDAIRSRNGIQ